MNKYKVGLVSLGCDKNRIDSEIILSKLNDQYEITNDPKKADIIVVNTCGFIEKSKQESIDTILEMAEFKKKHNCKLLIATGCLTQRYGKDITELIPEIDILMGVNDYDKLISYIQDFMEDNKKITSFNFSNQNINEGERIITTQGHTAYIRIAEGCDNFCTYCIIPKIRGSFRSRKLENVLDEAERLAKSGVKEIILVAQDTTRYGEDIYNEKMLPKLLQKLSLIEEIEWIRVLYCYPEQITDELILEIKNNKKVCKYLDIPLQHISSDILKRMGRKTNKEQVINVIEKLRSNIPEIILRTSIIVGFPGETKENFEELKTFVKEYKLDKLGVFTYSQEEGTPAAIMEEQIEEQVKLLREEELMLIQKDVSNYINSKKLNKVYDVIIEGFDNEIYYGRSTEMAPDVDGAIIIESDIPLENGHIVKVKIKSCLEYDLMGVVLNESCK
ncbi:30S ribosomal protein S12 methylthiotransferase RimO [Clostridium algidicarnis]|uniref:Ribosomal protein uS12 methylthiotransferase RimO n=1 Tax=Clostridium algidicarnis TaxID=37659 RepID=A0ABS6C3Q4_9CLOT|nr:30S ribosomal protein S12 methylthiotransferase RimO [Clostridium algidicarnis]MBU3220108.1 30S ribosomal protein S12 methylthiotransferase RimO [Clostridium algidicarnis]